MSAPSPVSFRRPALAVTVLLTLTFAAIGVIGPAPQANAAPRCDVRLRPADNVQAKIDRHPEGTMFCFRSGVYRLTKPIRPKSNDRLVGLRGAVLNGSKIIRSFDRVGEHWVARNQTQQSQPGGETCRPSGYTGCRYAEGVFINDRSLRQVTDLSELGRGDFYFDYDDDAIYLADDPGHRIVEASVTPAAIAGFVGFHDHVTVKGFTIEKFTNSTQVLSAAIKPGAHWTIVDNDIRLNHRMGIALVSGTVVRGNRIHHNGAAGMKGSGNQILIEKNLIANNNIESVSFAFSAGARFTHTTDLIVRRNRVVRNRTFGLKTDTDNVDVTFERNKIIGNVGCGIVHEVSYDAVIRNNLVRNNCRDSAGKGIGFGANILILSSPRVEIYGNTVVSSIGVNAIGLVDAARGSGPHGGYRISDGSVHDNVLKMVRGAQTGLVGNDPEAYSSMNNSFQDNTYYLETRQGTYWQWDGALNRKQWQASGNDTNGTFRIWRRG